MDINLKSCSYCVVIIRLLLMSSSCAQRPYFAGIRPPNGLNQKDKYYSTTPPDADIQNRFGAENVSTVTNQIPFGQTQKPPLGQIVVLPASLYTPLIAARPHSPNKTDSSLVIEDRFGVVSSNTTPSLLYSSSSTPTTIPLDAQGDQLLVDQLNQIPIDKRPFWFINYQAIEAQRNGTATNSAGGHGSTAFFFG